MTDLPIFFNDGNIKQGSEIFLNDETLRHVVLVLRMNAGERIRLTDGRGNVAVAKIIKAEKKKCAVIIEDVHFHAPKKSSLHLAIAFTRNSSRNEWLLEKATELGVQSITSLITNRSVREKIRHDRWRNILVSALLQSQQYHLPDLNESKTLEEVFSMYSGISQKIVAHCIKDEKRQPIAKVLKPATDTLILIGPEGDFSTDEVDLCMAHECKGVSLGAQRLRTETAAMAACAYFNLINDEG